MMEEEETPNGETLPLTGRVPEGSNDDRSLRCGWLGYRPDFLQRANNARCLLASLCFASTVLGMIPTGFVNVCLTTIEKRYQLSSTDTGMIAGSVDVAFVTMCLPVSWLASRQEASKPRLLGGGMLLMGLGSFIYALPHFLSPPYRTHGSWGDVTNTTEGLCAETEGLYPAGDLFFSGWTLDYRYVFILGQIFHGIGSAPLLVLGLTFLDESVSKEESPLFIGIYSAMMVGGAALGFAIGSVILNVYIDWPYIDPATHGLTPSNDLWLGCWWLCFMISGCAATLVAIPILAFPRKIRTVAPKENFTTYTDRSSSEKIPPNVVMGDLESPPADFRKVLRNKTFMALAFAECCPSMLSSGLGAFMPKIVESVFSMSASSAALVVGSTGVPSGCLGSLFGGWLLRKLNVDCAGALKLCIIGSTMLVLFSFTFVFFCPNHDFAGVTVQYQNNSVPHVLPDLVSACNMDCGCHNVSYNPVCGVNNVVYYSPCHAGCTQLGNYAEHQFFSNCSCIPLQTQSNLSGVVGSGEDESQYPPVPFRVFPAPLLSQGIAVTDKCPTPCNLFPIFTILAVLVIFLAFAVMIASINAGLRSIEEENRSIGFGVRAQICRSLGNIPGPIMVGAFIDRTCLLWEEMDGEKGSCAVYDHSRMNWTVMFIILVCRSVSTFFYILARCFHDPSSHTNVMATEDESSSPSSDDQVSSGVMTDSSSRSDTPSGVDLNCSSTSEEVISSEDMNEVVMPSNKDLSS